MSNTPFYIYLGDIDMLYLTVSYTLYLSDLFIMYKIASFNLCDDILEKHKLGKHVSINENVGANC